jgi:hypothetical protein
MLAGRDTQPRQHGRTGRRCDVMRRLGYAGMMAMLVAAIAGCDSIPNMDETGSGCANRAGAGPRNDSSDPAGVPLPGIEGLRPAEAVAAAAAQGHVVVFRLNSMACVCVPPTGYGPVAEGWWGSRGQLYLDLGDVEPRGQELPDGAGC